MSVRPAEEWVKKAEDNYISAITLASRRSRPVPDVICNQCHQCAEKYLKALLVRHHIDFPKTHDLVQLKNLLAAADADVKMITDQLATLVPYAIDVRYPGAQATLKDAREAIRATKAIRKFVRPKLGLRSR